MTVLLEVTHLNFPEAIKNFLGAHPHFVSLWRHDLIELFHILRFGLLRSSWSSPSEQPAVPMFRHIPPYKGLLRWDPKSSSLDSIHLYPSICSQPWWLKGIRPCFEIGWTGGWRLVGDRIKHLVSSSSLRWVEPPGCGKLGAAWAKGCKCWVPERVLYRCSHQLGNGQPKHSEPEHSYHMV